MNNTPIQIINLTMKEDKKEIFKELIINYLLIKLKKKNSSEWFAYFYLLWYDALVSKKVKCYKMRR